METPKVTDALRDLLEQIDAGEIEATAAQRAYLAGALDALTGTLQLDLRTEN